MFEINKFDLKTEPKHSKNKIQKKTQQKKTRNGEKSVIAIESRKVLCKSKS